MKKIIIAAFAVLALSQTYAASTNKTTGTRVSASERVTLNSLIVAAWEKSEHPYSKYCLEALSAPSILFSYVRPEIWPDGDAPIVVSMNGETAMPELNSQMSDKTGMILACSEFLAMRADQIGVTLRERRPNRAAAIAIIKTMLESALEMNLAWFKETYLKGRKVGTYVAAGNMGFASNTLFVPGTAGCYRIRRGEAKPGSSGLCSVLTPETAGGLAALATWDGRASVHDYQEDLKKSVGFQINGVPPREVIFKGIFAFSTIPTVIKIDCPASSGKNDCSGKYLIEYDGSQVTVKKNGVMFFDKSTIGGAEYAIDLSGETGNSTNTQVQTKGGW